MLCNAKGYNFEMPATKSYTTFWPSVGSYGRRYTDREICGPGAHGMSLWRNGRVASGQSATLGHRRSTCARYRSTITHPVQVADSVCGTDACKSMWT
jgi:hypothetical protein